MFGMLEIVFSRDEVAIQGFGPSQFQIAFIVLLRILGLRREAHSGGFAFP
ncbi:MAG TPA: hypothetical protein VHB49_04395 [Bradyrhizobium sp.]|nr:hypothetical protein [Bradyrhizobium sp.]